MRPLVFWKGRVRCALGIHSLKAWKARESFEQVDAYPMPPRALPGPGDHRRCDFCGATWEGAYDGMSPFWMRTRRGFEATGPIPTETQRDGS